MFEHSHIVCTGNNTFVIFWHVYIWNNNKMWLLNRLLQLIYRHNILSLIHFFFFYGPFLPIANLLFRSVLYISFLKVIIWTFLVSFIFSNSPLNPPSSGFYSTTITILPSFFICYDRYSSRCLPLIPSFLYKHAALHNNRCNLPQLTLYLGST